MVSPFPGEMYYSDTCNTNIEEGTEGCKVFDPTSTTKDVSDHSAASVPPSGCWPRGLSIAYHETLVQNGGGKGVGVCKL